MFKHWRTGAKWLLLGTILMSYQALGDWATISPEELAAQSDMIVSGECLSTQAIAFTDGEAHDNIAILRVDSVYKGTGQPSNLILLLPPSRPNGLMSSVDTQVTAGQKGLWYLQKKREGLYWINRPDRFVDSQTSQAHINMLEKIGGKTPPKSSK